MNVGRVVISQRRGIGPEAADIGEEKPKIVEFEPIPETTPAPAPEPAKEPTPA